MQVEKINAHMPQGLGLEKVNRRETPGEPQNAETLPDVEQPAGDNNVDDNAKGVLRLLQEGHFKGVADIRLRINFQDELAAIEGSQLSAAAGQNSASLTESVGPGLQAIVDSGQITQEQADQAINDLDLRINDTIDSFLSGDIQSKDGLSSELKTCFDAFVAFLSGAANAPAPADTEPETLEGDIEPPATEPPVTEPLATEPPATEPQQQDTQSELNGFVEEMTAAFDTVLTNFINALGEVKVLPELSPPNGNGVAYQKFLEIYNQLYGLTPEPVPDQTPSLDAVT